MSFHPLTFGITMASAGPLAQPGLAATVASVAEALGFAELWVTDHIVMPIEFSSRYPYSPDGRLPNAGEMASPDPLIWLAYAAAKSSTIRLGTCVLVVPQREPLLLAKQVATLDVLAGGRIDLGVGVGWLREEFEAIGEPFAGRGGRMEEQIHAARSLWTDHPASFRGKHVSFPACSSLPQPVQPMGVPIIIGGDTKLAAQRAGRLGDGWFPGAVAPQDLEPLITVMRDTAEAGGRVPDSLRLLTGFPRDDKTLDRLVDLGFSHLTVGIAPGSVRTPADIEARLQSLASRVGLV
jgi:probable F420-dependent oxidoreductase